MRWLDAFLPELFYGALVSVAVLVVAWALLETWDPHREFIAEARAHADGPVGKPPAELERLNERDDAASTPHDWRDPDPDDDSTWAWPSDIDLREDACAWPGDVQEGDEQFDAGTARLQQALAEDTKRLQSRGIEEGTHT